MPGAPSFLPDDGSAARASNARADRLTCAQNVAADDRAFASGSPVVRTATLTDSSLSIGVGIAEDAPVVRRARERGLPVVRRRSGGSAVVHGPGDLVWSVVLPRSDPRVGRSFVRAYGRLGAGVVAFLRDVAVSAEWTPAPDLSHDVCVLSGRGDVLAVGEAIVGGAAQRLNATRLLHHGMVSRTVDRSILGDLFPETAAGDLDRLSGLDVFGVRDDPAGLAAALAVALETSLTLR